MKKHSRKFLIYLFYLPVSIVVNLIMIPFYILLFIGALAMKVSEYVHGLLYQYSMFLTRHSSDVDEVKNPDVLKSLGFSKEEIKKRTQK